jgi:hypothetical protein
MAVDLRQCPTINSRNELTNKDYIKCIRRHAYIGKLESVIPDKPKENVEASITNVTNNFFITVPKKTGYFFKAVNDCFGFLDHNSLTPYDDENLDINYNNIYFVFKGGNTIKLWINKLYLDKMNKLTTNLQEILSTPLQFNENNSINSYSDFDFSLYIDFNYENQLRYEDILAICAEKLFILRQHLNSIITEEILINCDNTNTVLEINKYLNNKYNRCFNKTFGFSYSKNVRDFILTRNINNISETKQYIRDIANNLVVSFNNIIMNNESDFDLYRIKLSIDVNKNNNEEDEDEDDNTEQNRNNKTKFKSEIFDLSIPREQDNNRQHFCDNIRIYTNIINTNFNNYIIPIRAYNIKYLLIDLYKMLFIQKKLPWLMDKKKYMKRVTRAAILTSLYNQENYQENNQENNNSEFGFGLLNLFNILSLIQIIIDDDFNRMNTQDKIRIFKQSINFNLNNINNDNDLQNIIRRDLDRFLNNILDGINNYDNLEQYYIHVDNPNKFLYLILLIFMRKIIIENDNTWNEDLGDNLNMRNNNLIKFLKTYAFFLINSLFCLTDIKIIFDQYFKRIFQNRNLDLIFTNINPINNIGGKIFFEDKEQTQFNSFFEDKKQKQLKSFFEDKKQKQLKSFFEDKEQTQINSFYPWFINKNTNLNMKDKLKNNLIENLKKLYKINNYFEDKEHPYLLNSNMKPEIIRQLINEDNIYNIFNLLKNILLLK